MRLLIQVLFFLLLACKLTASAPKDTFELANEAFEKGAIDDAIQLYESVISHGFQSETIYFNLGTAYIKKKNWSAARFYLEKGIQEDPHHAGLEQNLAVVREQVDDLYNFPQFPLTGLVNSIHSLAGKNFISLLLLTLFLGGLAVFWLKPVWWRPALYLTFSAWILLLGLFLLEIKNIHIEQNMAIVWQNNAPLFEKPETDNDETSNLKAGIKVRTLEKVGSWCRVDLADGTSGWIEDQELKFL